MKIFNKNKHQIIKTTKFKYSKNTIGKSKLLPSYSKEWNNIVYFFNKNLLKNMPNNIININNIIKNFFDLYFKRDMIISHLPFKRQIKILAKKGRTLSKIFVSNVEISYINFKTKITLYVINREKNIVKNKVFFIKKLTNIFIRKNYFKLLKKNIIKIYNLKYKNFYINSTIHKNKFIKFKLIHLNTFIKLKNLYFELIITKLIKDFLKKYSQILIKYESKYYLNQSKFNNLVLLPKLSYILNNILEKKIEYNIINLKSIANNTYIFTNILARLVKRKKRLTLAKHMQYIIDKVRLPKVNTIIERTRSKNNIEKLFVKYNNPNLVTNMIDNYNFDSLINNYNEFNNNKNKIHQILFNSINYKNMSGLKIELKGRLTKRYRADRAIFRLKSKGGLRNVYSSYQGLSSPLFRGNIKSNISYSFCKSKRRIGSFAVKGWIGGK